MAVPTILEQADFVDSLLARCRMASGQTAGETWMRLTKEDCEELKGLKARLERMAPYEAQIKRVVTGK